jgi:exodeoxyribonuclease-3
VRVATWNVNGLKARFDFLAHWLRERRPDVVALQELKLVD